MPLETLVAPDNGAVPIETKLVEAAELQAALVNSKLRLFKADTIEVNGITSLASLEAAECDFDGYPAGGITLAAWGDPIMEDNGASVLVVAPSKQFNWTHVAEDVENDVGGAFVVDADGDLRAVVAFEEAVHVGSEADGLVVTIARRI